MSPEKFKEFKKYLQLEIPGLLEKFPNKDLGETFVNGAARTIKPESMSFSDWNWFRQVELDWMIDNDLSSKEHFIMVNNGFTSIKIKEVIKKEEINNDSTRVTILNGDTEQVFDLVGNIDYINARLYKQVASG